jgi:hypothetical protein
VLSAALLSAVLGASPFTWPVPYQWRRETFTFPIEFAPELKHQGLEELRFSPGMFKPNKPDFFGYAWVWWLDGKTSWTAPQLGRELELYFAGLARDVDGKGFAASGVHVRSQLRGRAGGTGTRQGFAGTVDTYEPFATHAAIRLNVHVRVFDCPGHTVALFQVSPRRPGAKPWKKLDELAGNFRCSP